MARWKQAAARSTDPVTHGSAATGIIGSGSPNVRIAMLPAARAVLDCATECVYITHLPIPPLSPAPIVEGAATVRINGFPAAHVMSSVGCGAVIQQGAISVFLGGVDERERG